MLYYLFPIRLHLNVHFQTSYTSVSYIHFMCKYAVFSIYLAVQVSTSVFIHLQNYNSAFFSRPDTDRPSQIGHCVTLYTLKLHCSPRLPNSGSEITLLAKFRRGSGRKLCRIHVVLLISESLEFHFLCMRIWMLSSEYDLCFPKEENCIPF